MQTSVLILVVAALACSADAFAPSAGVLPLRSTRAVSHKPQCTMSLSLQDNIIVAVSNAMLLAADTPIVDEFSDGSKTDRLYNGKALTGAVEAPGFALPLLALGVGLGLAVLIPLILKPGTDAFNAGRPENRDDELK